MTSAPLAERVLHQIRDLVTGGELPPGGRLDPVALADTLLSSTTPVRDALQRLTGERLVESRAGSGFHLPHCTEPDLVDLYLWRLDILLVALRCVQSARVPCPGGPRDEVPPRSPASVFEFLAGLSPNREHGEAMRRVNLRLRPASLAEDAPASGPLEEAESLHLAVQAGDYSASRRLVVQHHRARCSLAGRTVRRMYAGTKRT